VKREVRSFKTTTKELMALSEWLSVEGCTHIVMAATGVYWKPVWHILADGEFELVLANAAHVKNVPGRKTDVNDATPACAGAGSGWPNCWRTGWSGPFG
jgi:transposase